MATESLDDWVTDPLTGESFIHLGPRDDLYESALDDDPLYDPTLDGEP